jgi:3-oxoadipate enol-lactonase
MPIATISGVALHYELDGDPRAPVVMLSNALGATLNMWEPQLAVLSTRYRVLRYDCRGHGQSAIVPGPCSIGELGNDAIGLLDHLGIAQVDLCGLSMGGLIAMWMATQHRARIRRLILCNTGAKVGTPEIWNARLDALAAQGVAGLTPAVLERWFTAGFSARAPHVIDRFRAMLLAADVQGYASCMCALRDADLRPDLVRVGAPTLVITGRHDTSTPRALGVDAARAISGSALLELDCAHLSNWEQAGAFSAALMDFLDGSLAH